MAVTTHVLILGASQMQVPAIDAVRALGWKSIVADGNDKAAFAARGDYFEHVDLADPEAMLVMARRYHHAGKLHGVFTAGTDFSATVAYVAEALGLPGNTYQAALNASVKSRMRQAFQLHGVPSPAFVELADGQQASVESLRLPLVVKPVDNMGARGVSKVEDPASLGAAVELARSHSRSRTVIIEEWISGPEFSLDSLLYQGKLHPCGLARRHIHFPPYFVELGHTLPADLSSRDAEAMFQTLLQAGLACGLQTGALKGDVFWTDRGPVIGEIANRLSGGYMSGWTYPLASGVNLTQAALKLAVGEDPGPLDALWQKTSAERALVSIPGTLARLVGADAVVDRPGIRECFLRTAPGSSLVFPVNNVQKAGNIIACLPEARAAVDAAESAVASVVLELAAPDPATETWLAGAWHHPDAHGSPGSWPAAYPGFAASLADQPAPEPALSHTEHRELVLALPVDWAKHVGERCLWDYRRLGDTLERLSTLRPIGFAANGLESPGFWRALARGGLQAALYYLDSRLNVADQASAAQGGQR